MKITAVSSIPPDLSGSDLLHWLVFSSSTQTSSPIKVVWDLSAFVKEVLGRLQVPYPSSISNSKENSTSSIILELSKSPHRTKFQNYKIYSITDKVFSVELNGSEAKFYDLSQYFPEIPKPSETEFRKLAELLEFTLLELGISNIGTLSSPVAIFKDKLKELAIPTVFDAPESQLEMYELALRCTPREWVQNYQIGHFPELQGYDISSAYPYHASKLPDLRDCTITRSTALDNTAYSGFLLGDFTVYPDRPLAWCSPFLADRGDGILVNFTGTVRDYECTLDEVRTLYKHKMGHFKLKYGWFISPASGVKTRYLFRDFMNHWYTERGDDHESLKSYLVKRVMTGLVGKLLESRKDESGAVIEYGSLYNPVYHALITSATRLQVFDFVVNNGITKSELVHVGVDGVKSTKHIPLPSKSPMGQWRCSGSEPTIVLSPGAVITDHRNFKQTGYADLWAECMARPNARKLGVNGDIDLGRLFINQTRDFERLPRTAKDLLENTYQSEPV